MKEFHFTQPFIIIAAFMVRDGKILLIQENLYPDAGKWNLPGGKLDVGESPEDAARREAYEESGLDFVPTAVLGIHSTYRTDIPGNLHPLRVVYLGEASGEVSLEHGESENGKTEIVSYKWLTPEEIFGMNDRDLRYVDIKLLVQKWQQNITYPLSVVEHMAQTL
jgi:8-oxo-dGTP pyrophosphatase MutT (NUDIX family)